MSFAIASKRPTAPASAVLSKTVPLHEAPYHRGEVEGHGDYIGATGRLTLRSEHDERIGLTGLLRI
jgi:hypothetical protein